MVGQFGDTHKTRFRLLRAAELIYIEHGYEAMSLRLITQLAEANMAAVNYYFGSKGKLVRELLDKRFDLLNRERLQLLDACERQMGKHGMDVPMVFSALFVPALRMGRRDGACGLVHMQVIRRAYSDPSPFIRAYLQRSDRCISGPFFECFARALPQLSRHDLVTRLQLSQKVLACLLADTKTDEQIANMGSGKPASDPIMLARLLALVSPILSAPVDAPEQVRHVERMMALADADAATQAADAETRTTDCTVAPRQRRMSSSHGAEVMRL